jgi:hypothetical protein
MSTTRQIEANRQNARSSSGPRTPEGKAVSRFNALKSGIDAQAEVIPGEDPAKLETLIAEYQDRFDASTPERRMFVDIMINCEWMLRRLRRGEASYWKFKDSCIAVTDFSEGRILDFCDKVLDRLQRRINFIQRNYEHALKQLKSIQDAAAEADHPPEIPAPPPEPPGIALPILMQPTLNQQPAAQIGFVPSISLPQPRDHDRRPVAHA